MMLKVSLMATVTAGVFQWAHSRPQYSAGMFGLLGLLWIIAGAMAICSTVLE